MGLASALASLCGCATVPSPVRPADPPRSYVVVDPRETRHCLRLAVGAERTDREWPARPAEATLEPHLAPMPSQVRRAARAAGLEPLLGEMLQLQADGGESSEQKLDIMRLRAVMRLSSLEIELSAVLFEADCVGDQMDAVLAELERRTRRQEIAITLSSIFIGAAAGIGAGIWDLRGGTTGPIALGISGGVASAALGVAAFIPRRGKVVFAHARNLLTPLRDGRDPDHLFPTFAFEMLVQPRAPGQPSPRDDILAAWDEILDEHVKPERREMAERVLFGIGGTYDANLVDVREQMFDVMESHLNAIDRELEQLYAAVGAAFTDSR